MMCVLFLPVCNHFSRNDNGFGVEPFVCACIGWRPYVEALGYRFLRWNIRDGGLLELLGPGPELAFVMIRSVVHSSLNPHFSPHSMPSSNPELAFVTTSYVLIYVSDDRTVDMLAALLKEGACRAIIVSERSEATAACGMIEKRGVSVALDQ